MKDQKRETLGLLALKKGDYQEALNIYKELWHKDKNNYKAYLGYGKANFHLEEHETARWAFYKAIEIYPSLNEAQEYIKKIESFKKPDYPPYQRSDGSTMRYRVGEDYLEVLEEGKWIKTFIKGVNIGLGIAGHYPGEFYIKKGTYRRWFRQIGDMGANVIRIYTVHPPSFYEALYGHNLTSKKKLYLIQGIWVELPPGDNFEGRGYEKVVRDGIREAVDVIFGSARLPERRGKAHGIYEADVSQHTMAFLFGREWESCPVSRFNKDKPAQDFHGECLYIEKGRPMEIWLTRMCDLLQAYEIARYNSSHPVSVINWPTLDPLEHPSESRYEDQLQWQGIRVNQERCNENEDEEYLDLTRVKVLKGAGFFATYHVYPYYPDFMNNDYLDSDDPYLAYLKGLKDHHRGQAILIAEFGVPSGREIVHWHERGWHHGGHSEVRAGEIEGTMIEDIYKAKMAGGIVFSWFDEWYKINWLFSPYEKPEERRAFWFNFQNAEQNYGLMGIYPNYPGKRIGMRGDLAEWEKAEVLYKSEKKSPIHPFNDGHDDSRKFKRVLITHDEGFLYILLDMRGDIDFNATSYVIGINTYNKASLSGVGFRGEIKFPFNINIMSPLGLHFLIHLAGEEKSRILISSSYDRYVGHVPDRAPSSQDVPDQGSWVMMLERVNNRRISKDRSVFYPASVTNMSKLRFGSLDKRSPYYNTLADFYYRDNLLELRIPWGLLYFADPSSMGVLGMDKAGKYISEKTDGIRVLVLSYKPDKDNGLSAIKTGGIHNATDILPEDLSSIKTYRWQEWTFPTFHTYLKEGYYIYKETLSEISDTPEGVRS